eukprot:6189409-Pleurochrysis_carterae.AAC.1
MSAWMSRGLDRTPCNEWSHACNVSRWPRLQAAQPSEQAWASNGAASTVMVGNVRKRLLPA